MSTLTKLGNIVIQEPYKRNVIDNADFAIYQRGPQSYDTSGTLPIIDRWQLYDTSEAAYDITQDSSCPSYAQLGYYLQTCLKFECTTADNPLGTSDYLILDHELEGGDMVHIIGGKATLSFWLYATKTGKTCIRLINRGGDPTVLKIMKEFTISQSNTWERHTWTFDMPQGDGWNTDNGIGLAIQIALCNGSASHGAEYPDTWTDFSHFTTANQVNHMDTIGNVFKLALPKLEKGSIVTPYESITFADHLAKCERYLEMSYNYGNYPGEATSTGIMMLSSLTPSLSTRLAAYGGRFHVNKRNTPTITIYDQLGNSGQINRYNSSGSALTVNSIANEGQGSFALYLGTSSAADADGYVCHWVAYST